MKKVLANYSSTGNGDYAFQCWECREGTAECDFYERSLFQPTWRNECGHALVQEILGETERYCRNKVVQKILMERKMGKIECSFCDREAKYYRPENPCTGRPDYFCAGCIEEHDPDHCIYEIHTLETQKTCIICGKETVWNGLCQECTDRQVEIMSIDEGATYFTVDKLGGTGLVSGKELAKRLLEKEELAYEIC